MCGLSQILQYIFIYRAIFWIILISFKYFLLCLILVYTVVVDIYDRYQRRQRPSHSSVMKYTALVSCLCTMIFCGRGNINSYLGSNLWFTVDPFGFHGVPKWWQANFVYEVQQGLAIVVLMLVLRIWYFQLPQATTNAIAGLKLLRQPASI